MQSINVTVLTHLVYKILSVSSWPILSMKASCIINSSTHRYLLHPYTVCSDQPIFRHKVSGHKVCKPSNEATFDQIQFKVDKICNTNHDDCSTSLEFHQLGQMLSSLWHTCVYEHIFHSLESKASHVDSGSSYHSPHQTFQFHKLNNNAHTSHNCTYQTKKNNKK